MPAGLIAKAPVGELILYWIEWVSLLIEVVAVLIIFVLLSWEVVLITIGYLKGSDYDS
jgi:hypothetical protein